MIQIECCDNLELMSKIESNTVDLIYCDILYGTGRNFMDYKDLYPIREIIEAHYIPRIKEMHRILKPTGSIYLQMDTKINHWVRCILDNIFGYDNFRNEIIWHYETYQGKVKNNYPKNHDNIIFYSKTKNYKFNLLKDNNYKETVDFKRWNKYLNGKNEILFSNFPKTDSRFYGYYNRFIKSINRKPLQSDIILKIEGKTIDTVWNIKAVDPKNKNERNGYPTQKPKALIERIIKASSSEVDLVADLYLGSGTTAEVCKDLNRNFIGCDINPRAVELSKMRCSLSF